MKILVTGDRLWTNKAVIRKAICAAVAEYSPTITGQEITLIHGNARGADRLSAEVALELGLRIKVYDADWEAYGRAAGPIRNRAMIKEEPDIVLAFHNDIASSRGTKDCILAAKKAKLQVILITESTVDYVGSNVKLPLDK
jgi:hypothetical protein